MIDYRDTDPHAVYYDAVKDGEILSEGREFFISWDKNEVFKRFAFPDGRFFEEFVLVGFSQEEAKLMADECLAEWDQDIEEENDW